MGYPLSHLTSSRPTPPVIGFPRHSQGTAIGGQVFYGINRELSRTIAVQCNSAHLFQDILANNWRIGDCSECEPDRLHLMDMDERDWHSKTG